MWKLRYLAVALGAGLWMATPLALGTDADGDGFDDATGLPVGDLDGDCDIDLDDFWRMQQWFTGPFDGPRECCTHFDCNDGDACTVDVCDPQTGTCAFTDGVECRSCITPESCGTELVCDVPVAGRIADMFETDRYCFCVTEGENVRVSVVEEPGSGPSFNPNWRLVDLNRNAAVSCGSFTTQLFQNCGPLPASGSPYQVEVEDGGRNDVGFYKVHMQRLTAVRACEETALECDTPLAVVMNSTIDSDLLSFNAAMGEMVRIAVVKEPTAANNLNSSWRLVDGAGNASLSCGTFGPVAGADCGPLFPGGNPYRVEVEDGTRNEVGTFHVHLQRLTASRTCEQSPIECDVPTTVTIDHPVDADLLRFDVAEGELVGISVVELGGSGSNFAPQWRLVDGLGLSGNAVPCGAFSALVSATCGPLRASGNPYRIEIEDNGRNDVGSAMVHLQRLAADRACDQTPLTCGVPRVGTTESIIDTDLYSIVVPEGETIRVGVAELPGGGSNYNPNWRLIDGLGNPAVDCGTFTAATSLDCGPLPGGRNPYRVEIQDGSRNDVGNPAGSYEVGYQFVPGVCP